ncbi:MAG: hypothetical protein KIH69_016320 [Anaerolineae bacterium]|nr:hypothetical protein [Anaerolineae bacterium]
MNHSTQNNTAAATMLAASLGSFAIGLVAFLADLKLVNPPVLYTPAGSLSGKVFIMLLVWLVAWLILSQLFKRKSVNFQTVTKASFLLIVLGILGTFPPVWHIFG